MLKKILFIGILLGLLPACKRRTTPEDAGVWNKIKIDFRSLDDEGLSGPANGKVAINYEFCIPAETKTLKQVAKIDKTAVKQGGKGRVNCSDREWLVIGSTHQPEYRRVLYELASLPYVRVIQTVYWE